jgi:hypothetical protein
MPPIILCPNKPTERTDAAGFTVLESICATGEYYAPGPYRGIDPFGSNPLSPVSPLDALCVRHLLTVVDQLEPYHQLLASITIETPGNSGESKTIDRLPRLLPTAYSPDDRSELKVELLATNVDPRLWSAIIQLYQNLPESLRSYSIALSDEHLPLLQCIQSSKHFCLVTILNLRGCKQLADDTIHKLKSLHGLCALNASETSLSSHGIQRLSETLCWSDNEARVATRRGPWRLRVLRLCRCTKIDDKVFAPVGKFPLLSVLGGTLLPLICTTLLQASRYRPPQDEL